MTATEKCSTRSPKRHNPKLIYKKQFNPYLQYIFYQTKKHKSIIYVFKVLHNTHARTNLYQIAQIPSIELHVNYHHQMTANIVISRLINPIYQLNYKIN